MRKLHLHFLTFAVILFFSLNGYSQLTTSAIKGVVTAGNENLPGATVLVVHGPTGAKYGSTTNGSGVYNLANLNPGGPYSVTVSFVGYNSYTKKELYLNLGQTFQLNVELKESASELEEILVRGGGVGVFDGNTTGSKTTVSNEMIGNMPMLSRSISDVARLTPQAKLNSYGGLEIAGQNSKYNSFTIDGAVQNDVFGLASNGTNGGQINLNPMSMDIIDQITISVSPYDVTQSGFAGAGINAVTKSGTNKFTGTVYDYFRNQALAGKTPTDNPDVERKPLDDFTSNTTGFTLGGPIIKDKVFFFINTEIQKDNIPKPFDFATYTGSAKASDLTLLSDKLVNDYGYDAGMYGDVYESLNASKVYAKIDWNINQKHKFSIRHQYSKGRRISPGTSSKTTINFSNTGIDFVSTTNATTAELKSIFNNKFANKLLVGYTYVDDDRNPMGGNFPYLAFTAEKVNLGSESFSTANRLTQGIFTFTDDFSLYLNKHNITLGMHHEYYDMFNVFIRQNFGQYTYATIGDFLNLNPATRYQRSFSNIDAITGDGTAAAAAFKVLQLGFYAQDDYQVTKNFNLTYGLRVDVPMYLTEAAVNDDFNNKVIPYLQSTYNVDMMGAKTGQMPKASPLFSPRAGFNWDVNGDKTFQLRGGIGLFTSRIPYVWPGGQYNNNGITVGGMDIRTAGDEKLKFNPAWDKQPTLAGKPSGQIDLFAEDFKMPQVIRMNIAADKKLGNGFNATVDVTYTKNVNNVTYQNLLVQPNGKKLTGTGDNREIWSNVSSDVNKNSGAIGSYTGVFLGSNTNKGDAFNFMAQVDKTFDFGLSASLAYNYGVATSINDGQSSQNSSQWRVVNGNGRNNLDLGYSVYDLGHRIIANVSYKIEYSKFTNTTISLFYNGQSGERYSMGYNNGYDAVNKRDFYGPNGDNTDGYDLTLLYIPKDKSDINFVNVIDKDGNVTYSADQQWTDFNQFIEDHKSLKNSRGKVVDRHSERMPFGNILDLKVMQEFKFKVSAAHENKIQIALDVFNFTNMLNKNWGRMYYPLGDYSNYQVLQFAGYINDGTTPAYMYYNKSGNETWGIDDAGLQSSRWQAQLSVRYIF